MYTILLHAGWNLAKASVRPVCWHGYFRPGLVEEANEFEMVNMRRMMDDLELEEVYSDPPTAVGKEGEVEAAAAALEVLPEPVTVEPSLTKATIEHRVAAEFNTIELGSTFHVIYIIYTQYRRMFSTV